MYIYSEKLKTFLANKGWSAQRLAEELGVDLNEVEKMLNGEYIGVDTARAFIYYFKIPLVLAYIDFDKTGVRNPFKK